MANDDVVERFHQLSQRYDEAHGPGAALDVKDELGLGSGPFNDELTTDELAELNQELEDRLAHPAE